MADRYWVGGSGNWNATSTTNWATSSGGASGASAPTSADNVIFDGASNTGTDAFTVTVTGTSAAPALCADFSTSSLDGAMTLTMGATAVLDIYGSMTLPATNFSISGTSGAAIRYKSTTTGKTLTTNGVSLGNVAITFDGVGGGWTLGSAYTSTQAITLTNGTFDTGNYNITSLTLSSSNSNTRTLTLGSATLTLSGNGPIIFTTATNLTLNAGTSTINCSSASPSFTGGGLTFYNVSFTSNAASIITIGGANTYNDLTFTSRASTAIFPIAIGANQTVSGTLTLGAANTAIRRMFIRSDVVGTPRTITAATVATLSDVEFRDIVGAGTGTWSGTRLGNCGGNSGITFDAAKTVYRVGTGNWSATQWSLTSGGSVDVNNFPLAQDTAIFDTNTTTGTHTIDGSWAIGNLDMSALNVAVTLATGSGPNIHGNLTLDADVTLSSISGTGTFTFAGASNQTITSAGVTFTQSLVLNKPTTTSLILGDALTTNLGFTLTQGTLDLNNFNLTSLDFISNNSNTRSIAFGTGKIVVTRGNTSNVIVNFNNATNFSFTGTSLIESNHSGSTATRIFQLMQTGGTESNALNISITAGSDGVRFDSSSRVRNLNFTGFSGTLSALTTIGTIYGNLVYSSGMTIQASNGIHTFAATSGTQTITTNGKTLDFPITKNAASTLQLQDNLTMGSTRTLTHTAGTLDVNDFTLTTGLYSSTGSTTRQLDVGTGTIAVEGNFTASGSNYTTAGTGTISMTSASSKTFAGGSFTYPILNQGGSGALVITGANTFANITNTVQPATIIFPSSTTQNITNFNVNGTAGNLITIESSTSGTQATLNSPSNITNLVSYVSLKDSNAQGGIWQAPSNYNNTILTNVTGWFTGILHADTVVEPCVSNESSLYFTSYGVNLSEGIASNDVNVSQVIYNGNVLEDSTIADITSKTIVASAYANVIGIASVSAYPNANWSAKGSIVGLANVIVNGAPIGYEWTEVPPSSDIWLRQG
jgi:hypothetical protein